MLSGFAFFVPGFGLQRIFSRQLVPQAVVDAVLCEQLVVGAGFLDAVGTEDEDAVVVLDGGQAVGDGQRGAAVGQLFKALAHQDLALVVQSAGGLVQDQNGRVLQEDAGDGDALLLAAGELNAALTDVGVEAILQGEDEPLGTGQTGRFDDLLTGGTGLAVGDVVRHRAAEQIHVLLDDADVLTQALEGDVLDVLPVDEDAAAGHIVEAGDKVAQGRLAAAGGADQRQSLTGFDVEADVVQDLVVVVRVFEADILEPDGTGAGLQLGYSVVFFAAAFLVALRPEKLTRWLGRLLCPCLLVLILVLFGGCLLHPLAGQYGTPTPEYTSGAVLQGVLYGYQTMDTLAALNFGAIIALNIQAQGVTRQEEVQRSTILAGFVAGGLLLAVYAMLGHAGALTGAAVPGLATGADVLTVLADRLFGKAGLVLLAAIFVLACFNTCVGLIACVGEYFHTLVPSVPYPAFAGFFAAASMLISNLGLADILRLSVPVLNALYPVAILLICLSFVPELEQRHPLVYPLCIGCTALQSVASALPLGPLSALAKALPFGAVGFGWVLPAAVGILAGMLLRPTPHEP
mgnify:CR=1 FL=1